MHVPPMWRRWLMRLGLAVAIVMFIALVPAKFLANSGPAQQIDRENRALRDEIERLGAQRLQLQRDVHALATDVRAVEALARDELGLTYPGERVLKLVPRASGQTTMPATMLAAPVPAQGAQP